MKTSVGVSGDATEAFGFLRFTSERSTTSRTTLRGKIDARPSLDSCAEPSKERDARTPEVVIEVVAECETPEPNALVEPDEVVDEGARSPAGIPAEYPSLFLEMLEGGLQTACLYGPPTGTPSAARGPVRLRPYYQHPDNDEDERELSTPVQDAATACSCPALSTDSGRPCAVACDGEPWLVPSRSSSDRHYEAVEDGEDEEHRYHGTKAAGSQVPSSPRGSRRSQAGGAAIVRC